VTDNRRTSGLSNDELAQRDREMQRQNADAHTRQTHTQGGVEIRGSQTGMGNQVTTVSGVETQYQPGQGPDLTHHRFRVRNPYSDQTAGVLPGWFDDEVEGTYEEIQEALWDRLNTMSAQEVLNLQQALWYGGYYGHQAILDRNMSVFVPGIADTATREAFFGLIDETSKQEGSRSLEEILIAKQRSMEQLHDRAAGNLAIESRTRQLSDPTAREISLQGYAKSRMGARIDGGAAASIIDASSAQEASYYAGVDGALDGRARAQLLARYGLDDASLEMATPKLVQANTDSGQQLIDGLAEKFGLYKDSGLQSASQNPYPSAAHEVGLGATVSGDAADISRFKTYAELMKGRGQTFDMIRVLERDSQGRAIRLEVTMNDGGLFPDVEHVGTDLNTLDRFMTRIRGSRGDEAYAWVASQHGGYGAYNMGEEEYAEYARQLRINPADKSVGAQDRIGRRYARDLQVRYGSWDKVARHMLGGPAAVNDTHFKVDLNASGGAQLKRERETPGYVAPGYELSEEPMVWPGTEAEVAAASGPSSSLGSLVGGAANSGAIGSAVSRGVGDVARAARSAQHEMYGELDTTLDPNAFRRRYGDGSGGVAVSGGVQTYRAFDAGAADIARFEQQHAPEIQGRGAMEALYMLDNIIGPVRTNLR